MKGIPWPISIRKISCLQLNKCFKKYFQLYVAHAKDTTSCNIPGIEDFLVLKEFTYVFQEILGLSRKRDIDFSIYLVLGSTQISKAPYMMGTPELKELQMKLEELMKKGYIHPNISP